MSFTTSEATVHRDVMPGRTLPCGCRVGDYKTTRGATVVMIDTVAPECRAPRHRVRSVLSMIGVIADQGDTDTEIEA
jgi:hypothetical protein